jgi:hypothetical protein
MLEVELRTDRLMKVEELDELGREVGLLREVVDDGDMCVRGVDCCGFVSECLRSGVVFEHYL